MDVSKNRERNDSYRISEINSIQLHKARIATLPAHIPVYPTLPEVWLFSDKAVLFFLISLWKYSLREESLFSGSSHILQSSRGLSLFYPCLYKCIDTIKNVALLWNGELSRYIWKNVFTSFTDKSLCQWSESGSYCLSVRGRLLMLSGCMCTMILGCSVTYLRCSPARQRKYLLSASRSDSYSVLRTTAWFSVFI